MRGRVRTILLAIVLTVPALAMLPASSSQPAPGLQAGAAQAEITPPIGTSGWGYTARQGVLATGGDLSDGHIPPQLVEQRMDEVDTELYGKTFIRTEGVHSRLYARTNVLDDGEDQLAMVMVDLGGVPGELHQAVADRLADRGVPIEADELMISATHTHGGPGGIFQYQGYALLGGDAFDPRVFGLVADGITESIDQAWQAREPAQLAVGEATIENAVRNRSPEAHTAVHDHDSDHVDETARVIRIDAIDGTPIGVVTIFAVHGVVIGSSDLFFTGDSQGVAARMLADGIAEASPAITDPSEVIVTYMNGALGDISPQRPGATFLESVINAASLQAPSMLETWTELGQGSFTSDVDLDSRMSFLCFCGQPVAYEGELGAISPIPILGAGGTDPFPGVGIPGHDPKVPLLIGPGLVPNVVRFQVARIDGHVLATIPGEPTMALGEVIEEELAALTGEVIDPETVDIVGVANDYISYMTMVPEYDVQEYEGTFTLFGRLTGPLLRTTMADLTADLLDGRESHPGWQGAVTHPPTGTPSTGQLELIPGASPDQVLEQPAGMLAPGETARFGWLGGSPAVDHPVDEVMVRVVAAGSGETVLDDTGYHLFVWYDKEGADEHRWTVEYTVQPELSPGEYRFEITGHYVALPGIVDAYAYTSEPFTVT